jgi:hypothetical protein
MSRRARFIGGRTANELRLPTLTGKQIKAVCQLAWAENIRYAVPTITAHGIRGPKIRLLLTNDLIEPGGAHASFCSCSKGRQASTASAWCLKSAASFRCAVVSVNHGAEILAACSGPCRRYCCGLKGTLRLSQPSPFARNGTGKADFSGVYGIYATYGFATYVARWIRCRAWPDRMARRTV